MMEKEGSKILSDDESIVFEILPGKIGKLSGQDVRGMRNERRQAVWSTFCAKLHCIGERRRFADTAECHEEREMFVLFL